MHGPRRTMYYTDSRQVTLAELRKIRRFSSGKYAFSIVGLLKITGALVLFTAGVVFLAAEPCAGAPDWYGALPPAFHLSAGVALVVAYALFTLGFAEEHLDAWIIADFILLIVEIGMAVSASSLTLISCEKKDTLHFVPAVAGLIGALLLIMDAVVLWVTWRFEEEEGTGQGATAAGGPTAGGMPGDRPPPRKSIFL